MKVAIVSGSSQKANSIRGIGVHSSELLTQLRKLQITNSKFQIVGDSQVADVVHFTSFRPFFVDLPFSKPKNQKWILTIHDLIPLIYPKNYKSGIRGKIKFLINKFLIWKNIDQIITISETSKKDICRFLGVDPKIVNVIYLAPKEIYKKKKVVSSYKLPKKFVLYTGDINYNKNIPNLIKACEIAKIPLVIAGKQATEIEKMDLAHPETSHLAGVRFNNVIRLGYVPDEELVDLYNLATVYVQPSLYEGFGLPILEAIVCGTPVAVSKTQALVEIVGDDINYFDPKSPEEIAKSILNPNKSVKLPREYSWKNTAQKTFEVYEKI